MSSGKIILGTLAGIAIGTTLGILFAPEKGCVTRKKIKDQSSDYADGLKKKLNNLKDDVKEQFKNIKQDIGELSDQSKSMFEETKDSIKNEINTVNKS